MGDELDPAFLDLDSPHSSSLGDSLGDSFNTSLDLDLDLDLDSSPSSNHDHHGGFGTSLEHELDFGQPQSPGEERRTSGGSFSDHDDHEEGFATPRRAAANGDAQRMSLAFELASAGGPAGGRTRDLMRELGIEEDEDGQEGASEGGDEQEEEDLEEQLERRLIGGQEEVREEEEERDDPFGGDGTPPPSSSQRPSSRLRSKPSTASFSSFTLGEQVEKEEEQPGISQAELDAAFAEAAEALESSMATTGTFLSHLRQHTTTELDPTTFLNAPPPRPPHDSSASSSTLLSGSLQRSTSQSLLSSSTSTSPVPPPPTDFTDRQPQIEALASSVLKQLYAVSSQREIQLRELTEMERVFARNEGGWKTALAGLDPLPSNLEDEQEDEDGEGVEPRAAGGPQPTSNGVVPPDTASPYFDHDTSNPRPSRTSSIPAVSSAISAQHSLTSLRTLTTSLLSALSSITDLTQVQSALSSDAARKLRALKAQVQTVREELERQERSEAFVREYEAREAERGGGGYAERARREVEAVGRALEDGWEQAQRMFEQPQASQAVGVAV